jgi:uncharacterized membrane protein YjjP (DUF1212 family)
MNIKQLSKVALQAGEILLVSGAEIYRVEDTVRRICKSYNVESDCFVMPSGIFITLYGENNEPVTLVKRIKARALDLGRIEMINSFSRSLKQIPLSYDEASELLDSILSTTGYSYSKRLISSAVNGFVFTLLFRGTAWDALAAAIIGLIIYILNDKIIKTGVFYYFDFFVSGLFAGAASLMAASIFTKLNIFKIIIGSIMILVPGVTITNAIKDALNGDTASSTLRMAEAVFIAVAIAAGVSTSLYVGLR